MASAVPTAPVPATTDSMISETSNSFPTLPALPIPEIPETRTVTLLPSDSPRMWPAPVPATPVALSSDSRLSVPTAPVPATPVSFMEAFRVGVPVAPVPAIP